MKLRCMLLAAVCVFASCSRKSVEVHNPTQTASSRSDTRLIELVKLWSEDVGERGETAFQEIRSRQNAVDELVSLRRQIPPNDGLQPQIAFALLTLGHEYESNAATITSALSKEPRFNDFAADQAASMLVRLIHGGNPKLLPDLLRSAAWADGALAGIVGDEASNQLLNETIGFLTVLRAEPQPLRRKIYGLIHRSGSLNEDDKRLIQARLRKIEAKSPDFVIVRELRSSQVFQ